jgi:alpha-glucoside transport system permease protein
MRSFGLRAAVIGICLLWTIPTMGLLITSFRNPALITTSGWWSVFFPPYDPSQWTLSNYQTVLTSEGMDQAFINSVIVSIPSTIIPITIAAFAAYAFAWIPFRGRGILFTIVVALLVVPIQMSLIPILKIYSGANLYGSFLGIWLAHTGFGLPLAIFLLYNFISQLPRDLFESAAIDGASHLQTFIRIVLPLSVPALGAFAIFQFLWVWNDLLVALVFLGPGQDVRVMPTALYQLIGAAAVRGTPDGGRIHHDAAATGRLPAAAASVRERDPGRLRQVVTLGRLMIAFAGTELPASAARRITELGVGGVTLFRVHNVVDPPQVRALTAAIQAARPAGAPPLLIAADQEGGQLIGLGDATTQFAGRWRSAPPATMAWPSALARPRRVS